MTTNYERYFGTPERAADTLAMLAGYNSLCPLIDIEKTQDFCTSCPKLTGRGCELREIEWLEEESE